MSEYQYYEFRAIDHPLDDSAIASLRAISSRAEITPTSLTNVYHFGDFKGNVDRLMDALFDAFVYVANWGTHRFAIRLPSRNFDLAATKPFVVPEALRARATKDNVILDFCSQEEGGEWAEGQGWMASLLLLRADLLAGDLRCLYLGWLASLDRAEVDDAQKEPPVPPGLKHLSGPLKRFAEFLRLDPDLLEVAARASPDAEMGLPAADILAVWIAALPEAEKNNFLLRVMQGETAVLTSELLKRYRQDQARRSVRSSGDKEIVPVRRKVSDLLTARDAFAEEKRSRESARASEEQVRRAREEARKRERYLDSLIGREAELWGKVEAAISSKQPKKYDLAILLLKDLVDLGRRSSQAEKVELRIRQLRQRHSNKRSFIRRVDEADLPK
jgi:hypothetical protein